MTAYATDSDMTAWGIDSPSPRMFDFDYEDGRDQLLRLYDKGTRRQWIGSDRIDWSHRHRSRRTRRACPTRPSPSTARRGGRR